MGLFDNKVPSLIVTSAPPSKDCTVCASGAIRWRESRGGVISLSHIFKVHDEQYEFEPCEDQSEGKS